MARVRITWQRTCEYVATVDTDELREVISRTPGSEADDARAVLADIDAGGSPDDAAGPRWLPVLAYVISNTESGRDYLGAMADDNPHLLGGTGAPQITELRPA